MEVVGGIEGEGDVRDHLAKPLDDLKLILDWDEPLLQDLLVIDVVMHRAITKDALTEGEVIAQLLCPSWWPARHEEDLNT